MYQKMGGICIKGEGYMYQKGGYLYPYPKEMSDS